MTYRRRYLGSLRVEGVLDLLVCDETNPRSLATQLSAIVEDVDRLPRPTPVGSRGIDQRLALTAFSAVQLADVGKLAKVHQRNRPALVALLEQLKTDLPILSDTITLKYLSHLQTSRHLAGDFLQFNTARKP